MIALLLTLLLSPGDDLSDRADRAVARWDRADSPGGALAVVRGDEVVFLKTFGTAGPSVEEPMASSTPLYVASLAKPITAACALRAAAAGKVDLDAPLTETFPELPEAYGVATLRHCLDHRSGVTDVYDLAVMADLGGAPVAGNGAALEVLSRLTNLSNPPGERFLYSNSGYVLLAEAVRRGTGQGLAEYAGEHFFGPLAMEQASFEATGDRPAGLIGPGGMVASIDDLIALAKALHSGFMGDMLEAVPSRPRHPIVGGYADGWMHQRLHGQEVRRHFGGAFGSSADLIYVPALELSVIVLSSAPDLDAIELGPTVLSWLVPEAEPTDQPEVVPGDMRAVAGLWCTNDSKRVIFLQPGGALRLVGLGDLQVELVSVGEGRWQGIDLQTPFTVELVEEGLRLDEDGTVTHFQRVQSDAMPKADEIVGEYVHRALGARLEFTPGPQGSVRLEQNDALIDLPPFMPLGNDLLLCDRGAVLVLERDSNQEVVGFVAYANRAWGLPFERVK